MDRSTAGCQNQPLPTVKRCRLPVQYGNYMFVFLNSHLTNHNQPLNLVLIDLLQEMRYLGLDASSGGSRASVFSPLDTVSSCSCD